MYNEEPVDGGVGAQSRVCKRGAERRNLVGGGGGGNPPSGSGAGGGGGGGAGGRGAGGGDGNRPLIMTRQCVTSRAYDRAHYKAKREGHTKVCVL